MQTVKGLSFGIKAKNSSQIMSLIFSVNDEYNEIDITLCGEYDEREIQVDFDSLSLEQISEFIHYIQIMKRKLKEKLNKTEEVKHEI